MNTDLNPEQLVKDLKAVAHDAEELVKATAGEVSIKAREAQARLVTALESAKKSCERWEEKASQGAKVADEVVRDHPYPAMGVAFGLGILLGVLVTRR